ncbi:MAG: glycosyltransferase family 2 protein [Lachnospiraceae bacterium]|nr:glycosyltransferase family 2 protein [Lachnospiraceae bacterium]
MSHTDKVSIIVPMHNAARYIEETITSVVNQTYVNWELILVDDCSTDDTLTVVGEVCAKLPEETAGKIVTIALKENVGAANTRNTGLAKSTGRYVSYLDADDLWEREKLEKQIDLMEEKKAAFSFTGYEFTDENGKGMGKIVKVPETISYKQALQNTTIFTSTVMFDTKQIPREELAMPVMKSEDTALWFKLLRGGMLAYGLDENLVGYRRAGKSLSSNKLEAIRRIWNLYRKAERLSIPYSMYNFFFWAVRAVKRRI